MSRRRHATQLSKSQPRSYPPLPSLQQAWTLYGRGEWSRAEQLGRALLRSHPDHFGALTLLGIIAAHTHRAAEAAALLGRAVSVAVHDATAHNNYGNALRALGRYAEALDSYERALAIQGDYVEAHYNRGLALHELARHAEALESYQQALALRSDYAAVHNNRGVTLRALGRPLEALASHDRALAIEPTHASAHRNRGVVLQELGRVEEAVASYDRALALQPDEPVTLRNRGSAMCRLRSLDAAQDCFRRALRINPEDAEAHDGLGIALYLSEDWAAALTSFERAVTAAPGYAEAHYHRGNLLRERGQLEQALVSYDRAIEARAAYAEVHRSRGAVLHELGRPEESLRSYQRAMQLDPQAPWLAGLWLGAKMQLCDWDGIDAGLADLRSKIEAGESAAAPFNVMTLIDSPALQRRAVERWVARTCIGGRRLTACSTPQRHARIRIGYYSADFYHHATAVLAEGLFAHHDRQRFEIVAFRFGAHPDDEVTRRLAGSFDRFIDVRERSDLDIARLSRELEIDIAVDLKGYTQQHRVGIFVHGAAPVQVNYLGFPGTLGSPYVDYLIADPTLIPEDSRRHYSEKIVYLPDSYQVNGDGRRMTERVWSRVELGLPPQGFVYCCFNGVYKVTPAVFDIWMRVLGRVDGSVLWLLDGGAAANANLRAAARARGVEPSRLIFAARTSPSEHLARQRAADLFIDTYPCNAHTTASDALWAGLPLVTCAGESFASRVATSLLIAVGLPELVAKTPTNYEALLLSLATDATRLTGIRTRLEQNRSHAPLFDIRRYTRHLEDAYLQMYERHQHGRSPEHIFVGKRAP